MNSLIPFVFWYVFATLLGLLIFPLVFNLFPGLADRGYAFSRSVGLLLWGYFFWLLSSLGVIDNDLGGLILAFVLVVGIGVYALLKVTLNQIQDWWKQNRRSIWFVELIFLVAFAGWAFIRSTNPEISGTEKPMELAFINAILRSPGFPPNDPWLSGYSISYYYFGYVLIAMLGKLTAVPGSVAFNLGIALVYALSALGAYGLVYTLVLSPWFGKVTRTFAHGFALLGPLFILVISNVEGFLEVIHARGFFWKAGQDGQLKSSFWTWLDIKDLNMPPGEPFSWAPNRYLWWWRASRVVQDFDLSGNWREIIDEFPFFSYLLGDLHPHVLAMPFTLLAIALSLNLFFGGFRGSLKRFGLGIDLNPGAFTFAALVLGSLAFLNIWDFPIYVGLFCAVYSLRALPLTQEQESTNQNRVSWRIWIKEFVLIGIGLGLIGVILYLPFYLGFSSQAGGPLPNLVYSSRVAHLWVMFGTLLIPIFSLEYFVRKRAGRPSSMKGLLLSLGVILFLWLSSLAFGLIISLVPGVRDLYFNTQGTTSQVNDWLMPSILRRITAPGWVTLVILLTMSLSVLFMKEDSTSSRNQSSTQIRLSPGALFTLLLIIAGAILVLIPEYFYLRDQFGWRMNTIFKFYYQAWLLWGIAAAYGTALLIRELRGVWAILFDVVVIGIFIIGLAYPVFSLWDKTSGFKPPNGRTLDGAAFLEFQSPDDAAAIAWLKQAPAGALLEAVGPQYSEYARAATFSGMPNLLGWPGHESQWRGGDQEMGSRQADIETVYRVKDWEQTKAILEKYGVRYVYVGPLERNTYPVFEDKFIRFLTPVFQQGQVVIYEVPQEISP